MADRVGLEEIYEAVFDDAAFDHVLGRLAEAIGARSFVAGWHYNDSTATLFRSSGHWSDEQMALYNRDFALTDIFNVAILRNWREKQAVDSAELVSDREVENSILYNEFFRPIGDDTFRCLSVPASNAWGVGAVAFHRGKSQSSFDPDAVRLLDGYAEPLAQMLALRGKVSAIERALETSKCALDHVAQAVIVARSDGKVLEANAGAQVLLSECASSSSCRFELAGVDCRAVRSAIAAACDRSEPRSASILLPRGQRRPLVVTVMPLSRPPGARHALLLVQELMPTDAALGRRLQSLFGLTPAEAATARLMADGLAPAEIAARRRVGLETVRAQLKSLMHKLDCRRQSEAAAIIRSIMPVPISNGL